MSIFSRIKNGWNAFVNGFPDPVVRYQDSGFGYSVRPDRPRLSRGAERSIVTAVYNRISLDAASLDLKHIRVDKNGRYVEDIDSGLNNCLTLDANIDQTGFAFKQDAVLSLLDDGHVVLVPTDTDDEPKYDPEYVTTKSVDILEMRTGRVVEWKPTTVKVNVYNENTGLREDINVPKDFVAIVENPFYSIMNERNSTAQRLIRKLAILDYFDDQSTSGKLDLIIQLPYLVRGDAKRQQASDRLNEITDQLTGSQYGIAYIDSTEKITQLNRPVENNLMSQIEYLTSMLYSQLGITKEILEGTAEDSAMLNYYSRVIEPIMTAMADEMKRKFLTKTARTQGQTIAYFRDPFKLVPVNSLAEIADKFTRNEIMTSNEIRQIIGMKPSDDPSANELRNKNLNRQSEDTPMMPEENMDGEDSDLDAQLNALQDELNYVEGGTQ